MLPPDARSMLTDALRPPPGATLERAVALTFTLSLESALVVPLAFAAGSLRESTDQLTIMEAVRGCADRVDVFCQAGHIAVPERGADLLAFLEPMVHPVRRPRPGHLFHPKLWALRYRGDDDDEDSGHARLLVLSRNLTADRAWDVCLRLDGVVGTRPRAMNRPVIDLVRRAHDLAVDPLPTARSEGLDRLLEDMRRVDWEFPDGVSDLVFHALGIPGGRAPDFMGSRNLAISPFCNADGIARVLPGATAILVGRQEELDRLADDALAGREIHVVSELAGLNAEESDLGKSLLTGLHAKLYIAEKGHTARVLLGSANATDAGFGGNVELLVELVGSRSRVGIDTMVGANAPFRAILEPYERQPPVALDEAQRRLEDLVRAVAVVPLHATVDGPDEIYSLRLTSQAVLPAAPDGVRLTAELLTRPGEATELTPEASVDSTFDGLEIVHITPFVVLTAANQSGMQASTVVHARLVNDPAGRLDEVLARQVDTPEKFLRFLALLLGLGSDGLEPLDISPGDGGGGWGAGGGIGIFELLMRALVDRRAQLDDLARLVRRLESTERGRVLLPPGFAKLWEIVDSVRREII